MISRQIVIGNPSGIHAVYATKLVALVANLESDVFMKKGTKTCNCASLMSILGLGVKCRDEITVLVDGINEAEVMEMVTSFLKNLSD